MKSGLLQEHPEKETLVTLRDEYKYDAKNAPINVLTLAGFHADAELKLADRNWVYSQNMLPIPILNSPLLIYLGYNHKIKFQSKYGDSIKSASLLRTIMAAYGNNVFLDYFKANSERITNALRDFMSQHAQLQGHFFSLLDPLFQQPSEAAFIQHITRYTFELINYMERCVHAMFDLPVPVEDVLTPHEYNLDAIGGMWEVCEAVFSFKQITQNVILRRESLPEGCWFYPLPQVCGADNYLQIFKEQRVREYFQFLNNNDGRYGDY